MEATTVENYLNIEPFQKGSWLVSAVFGVNIFLFRSIGT